MRNRSSLGFLVLVVTLVAVGAWWLQGQPGREAAALGARAGAPAMEDSTSRAPLDGAGDAIAPVTLGARASASAEADNDSTRSVVAATLHRSRLIGRVIDDQRRPVAGAKVTLLIPGREASSADTDEAGEYRLEGFAPRTLETPEGGLHALAPDGRAAVSFYSLYEFTEPFEQRVQDLVLTDARTVTVEVTDNGTPALGAEVTLEVGFGRVVAGLARTDQSGRARFDGVPPGSLQASAQRSDPATGAARFGAAQRPSDAQGDAPLKVELAPTRAVTVTVRAKDSGAPLDRVKVHATRRVMPPRTFMRAGDEWYPDDRRVPGASGLTDAAGRVLLVGLPLERLTLQASSDAAGFERSPSARLDAEATEAVIEVPVTSRRARVSWPIVRGEVAVPPSGTVLTLRPRPGHSSRPPRGWPSEGVMQGTEAVIEDVPTEPFAVLATTPDGAVADLYVQPTELVGPEASFRKARAITVHVTDANGQAAEGWGAAAFNQGNNPLCDPVLTDADGVARLTGLSGGLADVFVLPAGLRRGGWRVGSVDLQGGDGDLQFTLPETFTATLRVLVDGAPRLPARIDFMGVKVVSEDPERALVGVSFVLPRDVGELSVGVRAPGYRTTAVTLTRANTQGGAPLDVRLAASGAISVELRRASGTRVELVAERAQDDGTWVKQGFGQGLEYHNADDGRFRFDELEAGLHRVRDQKSGLATEVVHVDPAAGDARVVLDLTRTGLARGTVSVPDGFELHLARVIVEGDGVAVEDERWQRQRGTPMRSIAVSRNGAFEVPVSVDQAVTLRAWHPELSCAPEGGVATLIGPREDVTLALVDGACCVCSLPQPVDRRAANSLRVLLFEDTAREKLSSEHVAPLRDGRARFGGFAPGTYTAWVDPGGERAPLVIEGLTLGAGRTDLGELRLRTGSSLRVRVKVAPSASPPRIHVYAYSDALGPDGQPLYDRQLNSNGEAEVVLSGFAAGTFHVRCSMIGRHDLLADRRVTLDGERDEVLEVEP